MTLSKKSMMMVGAAAASLCALAVLMVAGGNQPTKIVNADQSGLTLTLDSTNGLNSSQTGAGTYTWNTTTTSPYFVTWTGTSINYYTPGHFLHIAQNLGEFHNTITLHQITSITATGTEGSGSTAGELLVYPSKDGSNWTLQANKIVSGTAYPITETGVGFVKFQYNRDSGATENYVDSVVITYNCIA
jgi:hypothetical protein